MDGELRIVKPSVELITDLPLLERIERAGRICYRSEGRIHEGSAGKFVKMIIDRGHWSVLGHSQLYVQLSQGYSAYLSVSIPQQLLSQFTYVYHGNTVVWAAGVDAWLELFTQGYVCFAYYFIKELPELFSSLLKHERFGQRYGEKPTYATDEFVRFVGDEVIPMSVEESMWMLKETMILTLDRASAMQLRTHRLATHSVMSQRYINFEKYGFPYIIPDEVVEAGNDAMLHWYECKFTEIENYHKWIELGFKPEIARTSIGSDIESTMAVTATLWEWVHIFKMRLDPHAQPAIRKVMKMAQERLLEKYSETELAPVLTF